MNAPNEHIEDRLRRALAARADQVTPSSLRAAVPLRSASPRKPTWRAPLLVAAAAATVLVAGVTYAGLNGTVGQPAPGPATAPPQPKVVTGSSCPRESALVDVALRRGGGVPADVDGDGAPDQVVVAVDKHGAPGCRAFVGVRTVTGTTYSTAMADASAKPLPFPPEVIGVPVLGTDTGAEIVVDTHARADGALAQLFTLTDAGLVRVPVPGGEDGAFLVEGGGVTFPYGAGCLADGSLVLSNGVVKRQTFEVTRRTYTLEGDRLTETDSTTTELPVNEDFSKQFPEFLSPHFKACDGEVR